MHGTEVAMMNEVGPRVKVLRESQGLTQAAFAVRCNLVGLGISRGTLAKIETRSRRVTDHGVRLLVQALGVSVNELYL